MRKKIILEQRHRATETTIFLASMEEAHIRHLIKLAQDPTLIDLMGWNPFFEEDEITAFIQSISNYALPYSRKSSPILFGIYLKIDEFPIGYALLKGVNSDLLTAEVGLAILAQKYRKSGYGRLALQRIVQYAFDELQFKTIGAAILASNKNSINMCKKSGFMVKKLMPNSWTMPNGEPADMLWMESSNL